MRSFLNLYIIHMSFFRKSSNTEDTNDGIAKKNIKRMDTVVTGMILWGVIASIYGVKKLNERNHHDVHEEHHEEKQEVKRSLWKRIIFGNK